MDNIAGWSQADLRRYIVNLVLSDPGSLPTTLAKAADVASLATQVAASANVPVGGIIDWGGAGDPADLRWLLCDGRAVKRDEYSGLFAALSTAYGAGDGSTTFNLPDLRGRATVGPDNMGTATGAAGRTASNNARGNSAGEETHALSTAELAVHTHIQDAHTHIQDAHAHAPPSATYALTSFVAQVAAGAGFAAVNANAGATASAVATNQNTTATNQNAGSGVAHNNMPPFQVVNKIIRVR